jgi:hypothetical protein
MLIKLGSSSVPVLATLASRPALAWSCKSPSAWGSEAINPTTSLKTNAGHTSYADETWTISNWINNTTRTQVTGSPWAGLISLYSSLGSVANYANITISQLVNATQISNGGANGSSTVKSVLESSGTPLQKHIIVAQLNFLVLSPRGTNYMERCLTLNDLKTMASGSFQPAGVGKTWNSTDIVTYLQSNSIARPT